MRICGPAGGAGRPGARESSAAIAPAPELARRRPGAAPASPMSQCRASPPLASLPQARPARAFLAGAAVLSRRAPAAPRAAARAPLAAVAAAAVPSPAAAAAALAEEVDERLRLNNLSPQDGSRRARKRKGRGYGAGQGGTCGMGMRGQKSRSGSGIRPGFEGGQTPLYRKLPKLKGVAGGMGAGLPDFVTVNISDLAPFAGMDLEISLPALEAAGLLNLSGRESRLPLKVLGTGEIDAPLTVRAAAFSAAAKAKIEAAGGAAVLEPVRAKWTRAAAKAAGKSK
jgi:large subunit ribosomal protein L15